MLKERPFQKLERLNSSNFTSVLFLLWKKYLIRMASTGWKTAALATPTTVPERYIEERDLRVGVGGAAVVVLSGCWSSLLMFCIIIY